MNHQGKKSQLQTLAAGLLGFVGIVGFGSLVILLHGGGAAKAPASVYAAAGSAAGMPAPTRAAKPASAGAPFGASGAAVSSPAPLPPVDASPETAAAGGSATSVSAPKSDPATPAAAPRLVVGAHLDSSASASASSSAAAAPEAATAPAKKPSFAPKLDLAKNPGSVASTVHYGVSGRSELMGRAAGPVYNFSGNAGRQGGRVAADNASPNTSDALRQVDDAQRQIDAADVPDGDKATLEGGLKQVRETAAAAGR